MLQYVAKRVALIVPTLLVVLFVTYWLGYSLPGDAVLTYLSQEGVRDPDPETIVRMRHTLGLDRPFLVRWSEWMVGLTRGELGQDIGSRRDLRDIIAYRFPISIQLGLAAFVVLAVGGVALGTLAAIKQNTWVDNLIVGGALLIHSFPVFVLAPLSLILFVLVLKWLPSGLGWDGIFSSKAILPVLIFGSHNWVGVIRMTRAGLIDVLGQEYVRTARSKGLPERMVILRHILKNGLTGTVTSLGMSIAGMVSGSIFLESAFGIHGYGDLTAQGLMSVAINTIMATTLIGALMVMFANLATDLLYGVLDPRVRYE